MPAPNPASTVSAQYQEGGHEYFSYQVDGAETANRIAVTRFAPFVASSDKVVDFGCGTGWLLKLLDAGDKVGIEPNPVARGHATKLGIRTVESSEEIEDGWADVIVSNHALEHSLSPYDELVRLRRALKPGGKIVLCLPVEFWRAPEHRGPNPSDPNHHLFTWTPLLISNLLTEAGFVVEDARAFRYLQPYYNDTLFPILPRPVFDAMARVFGFIKRYSQLVAVAHRSDDATSGGDPRRAT